MGKRVARVEGKTPHVPDRELTADGLTEQEVWQRTLEPLHEKLRRALAAKGT